jgi:hypothetical protein
MITLVEMPRYASSLPKPSHRRQRQVGAVALRRPRPSAQRGRNEQFHSQRNHIRLRRLTLALGDATGAARLSLPSVSANLHRKKEGAGEELPAPWDASAPIVSYPAIKPDNFQFVKDGSVTSW